MTLSYPVNRAIRPTYVDFTLRGLVRFGKVILAFPSCVKDTRMKNLQKYMTVKEAAAYLGVSANTLRNWGKPGKIKERRNPINGYRVYDKNELDQLLQRIDEAS